MSTAFGGKGALLIDFFEDFIRHTVTLFLGKSNTRKELNEAWNKFEKAFFAEKVERQSPWYDKDDFGKYVEHPWDTQVTFKHNSGAEITYQY